MASLLADGENGGKVVDQRKVAAMKSAEFVSNILHDSAQSAFESAADIMRTNGIVIGEHDLRVDCYDRAAMSVAKQLTYDNHEEYL